MNKEELNKILPDLIKEGVLLYIAKALENKNRAEIYELVKKKKLNIRQISEKIDLSYQNTHNHIKFLENVGLVKREKQEKKQGRECLIIPTKLDIDKLSRIGGLNG